MSQPEWYAVWSTDDETLYTDSTGVYSSELEVTQTDEDSGRIYTYRFSLERLWRVEDDEGAYVTCMDPSTCNLPYGLRAYCAWFQDSLLSVAQSIGVSRSELLDWLCTDDVCTLARAYTAIGGYHGYDNLDSYPSVKEQEDMVRSLA